MEKLNWDDKMDELETIWQKKMAEARVEYQKEYQMLNMRRLISILKPSNLHGENSQE